MPKMYRYNLDMESEQTIEMPQTAMIARIDFDHNDELKIWAFVEPEEKSAPYAFAIYATGAEVIHEWDDHLASPRNSSGNVFHVFQSIP